VGSLQRAHQPTPQLPAGEQPTQPSLPRFSRALLYCRLAPWYVLLKGHNSPDICLGSITGAGEMLRKALQTITYGTCHKIFSGRQHLRIKTAGPSLNSVLSSLPSNVKMRASPGSRRGKSLPGLLSTAAFPKKNERCCVIDPRDRHNATGSCCPEVSPSRPAEQVTFTLRAEHSLDPVKNVGLPPKITWDTDELRKKPFSQRSFRGYDLQNSYYFSLPYYGQLCLQLLGRHSQNTNPTA